MAQQSSLGQELAAMHQYPALYFSNDAVSVLRNSPRPPLNSTGRSMSAVDPVEHLAFFCKLEVMSDRKTRIPFRIRLGSVDYVDRLERKTPGAQFFTEGQKMNPRQEYAPR